MYHNLQKVCYKRLIKYSNYSLASIPTAGADFDATPKVVTLAPGQREERVRVLIVDDSTAEETEIFTVLLSTRHTDSPAVATVTILDNDAIKSKGENA